MPPEDCTLAAHETICRHPAFHYNLRASEDKRQWAQADTIAMALVTAVAGVIRGIHLSMPADLFGDEIFYAREACIYVYQSRQICGIPLDAVSPHPPLGKLLISLGVRVLGAWCAFKTVASGSWTRRRRGHSDEVGRAGGSCRSRCPVIHLVFAPTVL
jgi:hypothetical protein